MKFSAARDVLLKPLQAVIGVVERRQTMPILSNVLLVAKGNGLAVTATDLEVELVAEIDVDVGPLAPAPDAEHDEEEPQREEPNRPADRAPVVKTVGSHEAEDPQQIADA